MTFDQFAASALLGLSTLLGVSTDPLDLRSDWKTTTKWEQVAPEDADASTTQTTYKFEAESSSLVTTCASQPNSWIRFPLVVHGVHTIKLGAQTLLGWGDPTYQTARSFFGVPSLSCRTVNEAAINQSNTSLKWSVLSYSRYFARFKSFPEIEDNKPAINMMQETMPALAGGSLMILALVTTLLFWGRVSKQHAITVGLSLLLPSFYLIASVPEWYGIQLSMFNLHKTADFSLWIGSIFIMNAFRLSGLFDQNLLKAHIAGTVLGCIVIIGAPTADSLQFGTMLPFPTFLLLTVVSVRQSIRQIVNKDLKRHSILQILSLSSFFTAALNDFFVVAGIFDHGTFMSIGMLAGTVFLALDVSERISDTYRERDYLRLNLEKEVERALVKISSTQAELVQQAKMASLGTLSAGIAHEINNSLNYVNGALFPLTRLLDKIPEGPSREKASKLIHAMEKGLQVTFEIIKSLRSYSGLNQAALKDHTVIDLVNSVLTIIKHRIPENIKVVQHLNTETTIAVNAAGISQVLMNLVVNAVDAMPKGGEIDIRSVTDGERVKITVEDQGEGMDQVTMNRIFEPFFTTKDVGKGTGLGLYICKTEIERHGGTLLVTSKQGSGTCFTIELPVDPMKSVAKKIAPRNQQEAA